MKILPTRRVDYGIRALLWLARTEEETETARRIATEMEIPKGFLHQILQALRRSGLVISRTGRTGGYRLARAPEDISILEVIEALEGSIENGECAMKGGPCHWDNVCALHWVWTSARSALVTELKQATLAEVSKADLALLEERVATPKTSHRGAGA
jgi:Rrf2 family protein